MTSLNRLREYLGYDPENAALALELIEALSAQGDFVGAREVLMNSCQWYEEDPMFISWRGHLGLALGKYDEAIQAYRRLFEKGFEQPGLKINCALASFQMGKFAEANSLLDEVETLDVSNRILKARCLAQLENLPSAITDVSRLLTECSPEQMAEVTGLLSLLYLDDAQYGQAEEYSLKALELDDTQFDARIARASLYLYKMEIERAIAEIEPLDLEYPETGRILAMKALVYMYRREFAEAINVYQRACSKMPSHVGSRVNLGWCYFAVQDLNSAEACFREGVHIDRTFAEGHGGLALISAYRENWQESQMFFKRGLKLDPLSPSALFARALYFKNRGRNSEAEKIMTGLMSHKSELSELNLAELIMRCMSGK